MPRIPFVWLAVVLVACLSGTDATAQALRGTVQDNGDAIARSEAASGAGQSGRDSALGFGAARSASALTPEPPRPPPGYQSAPPQASGLTRSDSGAGRVSAASTQRRPTSAEAFPQPAGQDPGIRDPWGDFRQFSLAEDEVAQDELDAAAATPVDVIEENDPWAPIGIRLGTFLVLPSVEFRAGYSDNVEQRSIDPEGGAVLTVTPEVEVISNWSRHELRGRFRTESEFYPEFSEEDSTEFLAEGQARIDIGVRTTLDLDGAYERSPQSSTDTDVDSSVVGRPNEDAWRLGAALTQTFGRVAATLGLSTSDTTYEDATLADGTIVDNSDRDFREDEISLRVGYDFGGGHVLFGDVFLNQRVFDREFDNSGTERGSDGRGIAIGAAWEPTGALSGEIRVGVQEQDPNDPAFETLRGLILDASLVWEATALTTVTLTATSDIDETVTAGSPGVRSNSFGVAVDHALRRNLIWSNSVFYDIDDIEGTGITETFLGLTTGLEYRIRRGLAVFGEVSHFRFESDEPGEGYDETVVSTGVRLSR